MIVAVQCKVILYFAKTKGNKLASASAVQSLVGKAGEIYWEKKSKERYCKRVKM